MLYPVLTMVVMAIVFSNVFKMSTPGVSYLAYLLSGLIMFNYFSEASNLAMSSVVGSFSLLNKIYIPKYIFPLSKFYVVLIATGTGVNIFHVMLPYAFVCLFMFTLGMGFILSAVSVFLRDMFYIYGIIVMLWTYLTPIMYDIKLISEQLQPWLKLNPLYHYVNFVREIVLYGRIPQPFTWATCAISSIVVLIIGVLVFKKTQDKFIYYV